MNGPHHQAERGKRALDVRLSPRSRCFITDRTRRGGDDNYHPGGRAGGLPPIRYQDRSRMTNQESQRERREVVATFLISAQDSGDPCWCPRLRSTSRALSNRLDSDRKSAVI